jgi:hypothetical protein
MAKLYQTDNTDTDAKEVGPRTNELLAGWPTADQRR